MSAVANRPMMAETIWVGSDGEATKAFYAELVKRGPLGEIAVALFRANKCSARAKGYRGGIRGRGSFKSMAYDRKDWSIGVLVELLQQHAASLGIIWGWQRDETLDYHNWVIYVDLAQGQVSFHTASRREGPDYKTPWDGQRASTERICAFCNRLLEKEGMEHG